MNFAKAIVWNVIQSIKKGRSSFFKPTHSRKIIRNVPYHSQFASKELVESFITGKKELVQDPKWKESGAKNREEYAIWAWNGCGMACLQMILDKETKGRFSLVELGKMCQKYGGYVTNQQAKQQKDYQNYYDGLFYKPFLAFVRKEFGIQGRIVSPMSKEDIIRAIEQGTYVIVSVHPQIREPKKKATVKRGHLVLVLGYDFDKQIFYLHNPSGYQDESQEYAKVSFDDLDAFFAHRGMVLLTSPL